MKKGQPWCFFSYFVLSLSTEKRHATNTQATSRKKDAHTGSRGMAGGGAPVR